MTLFNRHSKFQFSYCEQKGSEFGPNADFTPYYGPHVIALAACTAHIQLNLYREYEQSVPSRILLFPGKFIIDNVNVSAREIREISVSPVRILNRNSPDVFREMLIRTEKSSAKYRIDYRTGTDSNEQPFWAEYEQFITALSEWGTKNNVPVIVSYMA